MRGWRLALLGLVAGLGGCAPSGEGRAQVVITVKELTADIGSLRATLTLDGVPARPIEEIRGPRADLQKLALELPEGRTGLMKVTLDAIPAGRFVRARGSGELVIDGPGRRELESSLVRREICDDAFQGFCWDGPLYQGGALIKVRAFAEDNVWAIAEQGTLLRWDGSVWDRVPLPQAVQACLRGRQLDDLWASGPNDLWIVTYGACGDLLHYDGTTWSIGGASYTTPILGKALAITGLGSGHVFVAGIAGAIAHWDGTRWQTESSGVATNLSALWAGPGRDGDEVWAAGDGCTVLSRKSSRPPGQEWAIEPAGSCKAGDGRLRSVWSGGGEVWAVGTSGTVVRRKDGVFRAQDTPDPVSLNGIAGTGPDNLWAVGAAGATFHWNGSAWARESPGVPGELFAVSTGTADDVWAVGAGGTALRRRGGAWSTTTGGLGQLQAIWGSARDDLWAAGEQGQILHYDGRAWTRQDVRVGDLGPGAPPTFTSLWGSGKDDLWAVGPDGIFHHDGLAWRRWDQAGATAIWGSRKDDLWVVDGAGNARRWDGASWSAPISTGTTAPLRALSGSGPADVWAVGGSDRIVVTRFDGTSWSVDESHGLVGDPGKPAYSVWVAGPGRPFVGGARIIGWREGDRWSSYKNNGMSSLLGLWGPTRAGPAEVWAVGLYGSLAHFDGAWGFNYIDGNFGGQSFRGVFGASPDELFIIGDNGVILRHGKPGGG